MSWKFWGKEQEKEPEKAESQLEAKIIKPQPLTKEIMKEMAQKRLEKLKAKAEETGLPVEVIQLQEDMRRTNSELYRVRQIGEKEGKEIDQIWKELEAKDQQISQLKNGMKDTEKFLQSIAESLDELLAKERPEASKAAQAVADQIAQLWEAIRNLEARINSLPKS